MIALAIAVAPVGAAMAGLRMVASANQGQVVAAQVIDTQATMADAASADMTDCDRMKGAKDKTDCPCCDTNSACPPDLCPLKTLNLLGPIGDAALSGPMSSMRFVRDIPDRPPDWIDSPQPPPPRA